MTEIETVLPSRFRAELNRLLDANTVTHTVELGSNRFAFPGAGRARADEVCMVFRRPAGEVLTFRKTFYPPGVYRLPTGAMHPGEGILEALRREALEETGLDADPHRLAAVVGYQLTPAEPVPSCCTFAFLIDGVDGTPAARDPHEQVEDFRWAPPYDLMQLADTLEILSTGYSIDLESGWQ